MVGMKSDPIKNSPLDSHLIKMTTVAPSSPKNSSVSLNVIVGPMFAGKTSEVAKRLELASTLYTMGRAKCGNTVLYISHDFDAKRSEEGAPTASRDKPSTPTTQPFLNAPLPPYQVSREFYETETEFSEDGDAEMTPTRGLASSHSAVTRGGLVDIKNCIFIRTGNIMDLPDTTFDDVCAIAIDEAQFFNADDLVDSISCWISKEARGSFPSLREVIVSGLDGDYRQQPFPGSGVLSLVPLADTFVKLTTSVCTQCLLETGHRQVAPFTSVVSSDIVKSLDDTSISVGGAEKWVSSCRLHINH